MKNVLACLLAVAASGCPDVTVDPDEVAGPTVEFDPARSLATKARFIPFPNDLARDPMTGKIALGEQNCESATSKATREGVLNQLDGFGTYETAMQVTFTAEVDDTTIANNIVMVQLTDQGTPLATPAMIPVVVARVGTTVRFVDNTNCTMPEVVNAVTFVPGVPLEQKSTYFVALLKGIKAKSGQDFTPAYTWGLVASKESPVTLDDEGNIVSDRTPLDPSDPMARAQLQSLAQLWKLHAPGLAVVDAVSGRPREDILVGFQFSTQTVSDPLDPTVMGSPANKLSAVGLLAAPTSITGKFQAYSALCTAEGGQGNAQCFMKLALGGCSPLTTGCLPAHYTAGTAACQLYGCAAVGNIYGAGIGTVNYQQQITNMLTGEKALQGAWTDPVNPEQQGSLVLETIIVVPSGTPPMNNGWPTVVFGHGLTGSKENVFAIAGRLAAAGFATVAIDTAGHGSRASRISKDIALGCRGRCGVYDGVSGNTTFSTTECDTIAECPNPTDPTTRCGALTPTPMFVPPSPSSAPQCYAPFLSPDLAALRDGLRQTVLDHMRVVNALEACGTTACTPVEINSSKIYYAGMSLGSIIGTISSAMAPDIKGTALNVSGVGWADLLENTETLAFRCALVNGLIDAGILQGEKWTGGDTGLCTTDAWKTQPGFATFSALARWVIDPADPANFTSRLAAKPVLIQEVVGDTVVPNLTTDRQAALTGFMMPAAADPFNNQPSAAITAAPVNKKWLRYTSDDANVFVHSSLLRPAPVTDAQDGINGTLRLQVDAATFLNLNNQ